LFFDQRLAYLLTTGFFNKDKPWDKVVAVSTTKAANALEQALKDRSNTASSSGTSIMRTPEQDKTSKANIDSMRGIFGK
jgi:hypothetical protein